jgi:hypothetical protein
VPGSAFRRSGIGVYLDLSLSGRVRSELDADERAGWVLVFLGLRLAYTAGEG